jgi:DNA-binding NarL/FixJ family response regulator
MNQEEPVDRTHPYAELPTDRQLEILELIANGVRTVRIAETLNISVDTVNTHLRHTFERLEASNRTNAVAICIRRGWLK